MPCRFSNLYDTYQTSVSVLADDLDNCISDFVLERIEARAQTYIDAGAPAALAGDVARLRILATAKETVDCANANEWPLKSAACIKHAAAFGLGVDPLRAAARDLSLDGHWERLAQQRVLDARTRTIGPTYQCRDRPRKGSRRFTD